MPPTVDSDPVRAERGFYRPELDALRFFAFLAVFLRHTISSNVGWWLKLGIGHTLATVGANASQAGAFGVTLFYTLSAYLITTLLLREKARLGKLHVPQFYVRRALRIWPLYFSFLALGSLCAVLTGEPTTWRELPYFLCFAGNWGVIAHGALSRTMNQLWSVSVEEQFYIAWPLAMRKLGRRGLVVVAIIMLCLPVVSIPLGPRGWDYAFMSSFSGFAAMGAGVLLACWLGERDIDVPRALCALATAAMWYGASALHIGESPARSVAGILLATAGSASLLLAFIGLRVSRALAYLGKISYGLYVFHALVIGLVDMWLPRRSLPLGVYPFVIAGELALTIAVAALSYRWLESPFLRLKERFAFVASRPV